MTVNDLYMTIVGLNHSTPVTAYDKHDKVFLSDVENWGSLVVHYPESEVLLFNYGTGEITLHNKEGR